MKRTQPKGVANLKQYQVSTQSNDQPPNKPERESKNKPTWWQQVQQFFRRA